MVIHTAMATNMPRSPPVTSPRPPGPPVPSSSASRPFPTHSPRTPPRDSRHHNIFVHTAHVAGAFPLSCATNVSPEFQMHSCLARRAFDPPATLPRTPHRIEVTTQGTAPEEVTMCSEMSQSPVFGPSTYYIHPREMLIGPPYMNTRLSSDGRNEPPHSSRPPRSSDSCLCLGATTPRPPV